jgi:Prokaryotic E2 family A/ThiF family/Prokaryotic homologs of the JAB domain
MLYSENLIEYTGDLPLPVQTAVKAIHQFYCSEQPKVLSLNSHTIAVPINIKVSIPPNGTVGGIDIREVEPILIRINIQHYPNSSPTVSCDRKDFPKDKIPHLYISRNEDPAAKLCLVRGNVDEWFAERPIETFLEVIDEWFFKAANGLLTEDGGEFDPMRIEKCSGFHIYRYDQMSNTVSGKNSFLPDGNFACFVTQAEISSNRFQAGLTLKTGVPVHLVTISTVLELIKQLGSTKNHNTKSILSILVWHPSDKIYSNYEANFPETYGELIKYFKKYEIDICPIVETLRDQFPIETPIIPIIHAIKRPRKLIGFSNCYEFINFGLLLTRDAKDIPHSLSKVELLNHNEPFTSTTAMRIAGEKYNQKTLFIGGGSLGSKIILHNARSGSCQIGICDYDILLEHNLSRHTLFSDHIGEIKSQSLEAELDKMFEFTQGKSIKAYPVPVHFLNTSVFNNYSWLVDSTASLNVRNWLIQKEFEQQINIAKCELVDEGKIGLLYIEGESRNPRVDDLANLAHFRALKFPFLEKWRRNDAVRDIQTLEIGLGCSSTTVVTADNSISAHAAMFSQVLHSESERVNIQKNGLLYIQTISNVGIPETFSKHEIVSPFSIHQCCSGSGWEVRMMGGLKDRLLSQCKQNSPNETGGILLGVCNYKTQTIHIYDIWNAPPKSKGTPGSFIRSKNGLKSKVDLIKERTGEMIGYIGEWHTHPMNLNQLSQQDIDTVNELIPINRLSPIPTLSLIVTKTNLLPFIFL